MILILGMEEVKFCINLGGGGEVETFLDPRRTAGSIAIMYGFHLLLTYLDCRSVHLSEILVVCGDCLGKYVYIEFFFKIRV